MFDQETHRDWSNVKSHFIFHYIYLLTDPTRIFLHLHTWKITFNTTLWYKPFSNHVLIKFPYCTECIGYKKKAPSMKNYPRRSSTKTLAKLEIMHFGHLNRENKPRSSILADDQWTVVNVSFDSRKLRMIDNVRPWTPQLSGGIRGLDTGTFISWSVRMTEKSASLVSTSSNGGLCNPPTKAVASVSGRRLSRRARGWGSQGFKWLGR